jgi:hypothetical protein
LSGEEYKGKSIKTEECKNKRRLKPPFVFNILHFMHKADAKKFSIFFASLNAFSWRYVWTLSRQEKKSAKKFV